MKSLPKKTKYGLRALQYLARDREHRPVLISELAREEGLPHKFLEAILLELKHHGILESRRGKNGGYALCRDPAEVMIGQVIRILDGPLAPLPCVSQTAFRKCEDCEDFATCGTRIVMRQVRDSIAGVLDNTSLAALTQEVDLLVSKKRAAR